MNALKSLKTKLINLSGFLFISWVSLIHSAHAQSTLKPTDLTQDTSNGKNVGTVASNISNTTQIGATLFIQLFALGGFIIVALSLYGLYKASKDEREKPLSAIVGLFIGGLMAGVSSVMWIMKNSTIGS